MKNEARGKSIGHGAVVGVLLLVFCLVLFAQVRYTASDPRGWLLVSESLLTHGTLQLDHYGEQALLPYGYVITQANGHFYHYFPLGTPLASLPFVAVGRLFGMQMLHDDAQMQIVIAACVSVLLCLYLFKLARLWMGLWPALAAMALFWLGSAFASTDGTALWSHDFATLFATMAIYYAVRSARLGEPGWWPLIGLLLFAAYLTRPPLSILAPCVLLFLFSSQRRAALLAGATLAALLGLFALFSLHEFGQPLPDYYLPQRLEGGAFWTGLAANLVSPARGLLVFSPFLVVVWFCRGFARKDWGLNPSWLLIGLVWPLVHLVLISRFPRWWAGFAFGPRFMTDVLPGLCLLTLYAWPVRWPTRRQALPAALFAVSVGFAIFVNSYQGLFNRYTLEWNLDPNVEDDPSAVFDWRDPQFAANRARHQRRVIRAGLANLAEIAPGETIDHASKKVIWAGFSRPEPNIRWSNDTRARIIFELADPLPALRGRLVLRLGTLDAQHVTMRLNGVRIYSAELDGWDLPVTVDLPAGLVHAGRNELAFDLPDAHEPGNGDQRLLSIAMMSLRLE